MVYILVKKLDMYIPMTKVIAPNGFVDMLINQEYQPRLTIQLTLKTFENEMKIDKEFLCSEAKKIYNGEWKTYNFRDIFLLDLISTLKKYDKGYLNSAFNNNSKQFKESLHKMYVNQIKLECDYWYTKKLPSLASLASQQMI